SSAEPDTTLNFFYALIAMTCLYGGFLGLRNTTDVQADLSPQGARRSVAPTHKLGVVLYDSAAALTISLAEVTVLLAYLMLALRVNFGNQVWYVLLTSLAGCIAGVSLGAFIGTFVRKSENAKTGILIGTTMTMSFLAGLMIDTMKHTIARKAPVLSYINPAALITDAFYSLYVFASHRRFFLNIGLLLLISGAMCTLSFLRLRRDRYASL
ncbi:MAG: ABC transporter permease, partial [Bacillota bacterium]